MAAQVPETLVIERVLHHSRDKVWRVLTQPHLVREWLLEGDFRAEVGHDFEFVADFGKIECAVLEVTPQERIKYSWEAFGLKSVVTWTIADSEEGIVLRLEQTGFQQHQAQAYGGAHAGWKGFISNLEKCLADEA